MIEYSKPIQIIYTCSKCNNKINPEHFFCSKCKIQYDIGVLKWAVFVNVDAICWSLFQLDKLDIQEVWGLVENAIKRLQHQMCIVIAVGQGSHQIGEIKIDNDWIYL